MFIDTEKFRPFFPTYFLQIIQNLNFYCRKFTISIIWILTNLTWKKTMKINLYINNVSKINNYWRCSQIWLSNVKKSSMSHRVFKWASLMISHCWKANKENEMLMKWGWMSTTELWHLKQNNGNPEINFSYTTALKK